MKKSLLALSIILVLIASMLSGCVIDPGDGNAAAAFSVVTIDVNPSVKLGFNQDGKLASIEADNADGQKIAAALSAEIKNTTLDVAIEILLDKLFEEGYLGEYSNSILVSVEKGDGNIELEITSEIKKCFDKHNKEACVITQRLHGLGKPDKEKIEEIAEKYDISMGKARMIERIRKEFPALSEAELAALNMNELVLMLEGASESIIGQFGKHGNADCSKYISREEALNIALTDAAVEKETLIFSKAHLSREDGIMVYDVEFATAAYEYEYEINATDGRIVEKEKEIYEAPDIGEYLEDYFEDGIFKYEQNGSFSADELLDNAMMLEKVIAELGLKEFEIDDIKIRLHTSAEAKLFSICIELENDNVYNIVAEAHTGIIISAERNGTPLELTPAPTVE